MMEEVVAFKEQFAEALRRNPRLSDVKPSEWAEKNVVIPGKGRLSYDFNPYCREIIDTLAQDHPARRIAVMKGSQITFSSGVIMPALGWTIAESPGNTLLMVGASDLIKPAMEKLDLMIDGAKLQGYLRYGVERRANRKTGDTDEMKYFSNGYIKVASNSNSKAIAQVDYLRMFLDDFDAMRGKDKHTGSLLDLIEMRAASNKNSYKLMMISTPLLMGSSNIYRAFKNGDERLRMVECPCCHEAIVLRWDVAEGDVINELRGVKAKGPGGIVYERNNHGQVIGSSVGYVCYLCAGFFTDRNKQRMLLDGFWEASSVPISDDFYSYHISSLYAPAGMFDWRYYAGKHAEANPPNGPVDDEKMQVLNNTCKGIPHERSEAETDARVIAGNTRGYAPGVVPEGLAVRDNSGRVVLLTCAADLNGTMRGVNGALHDDARLDYSIEAWTVEGQRYHVLHGSIGTFVPGEGNKDETLPRKRWTYEHGKPNSVWPEFRKVLDAVYETDGGRRMQVLLGGVDCGHHSKYAYEFLDGVPGLCVGLRGDKEDEPVADARNTPVFKLGRERADYYLLDVNRIKDRLFAAMNARWDGDVDERQPGGFMNFPTPTDGLYGWDNFFSHYESESRELVPNRTGVGNKAVWRKKRSNLQNHQWDCAVYNYALRELVLFRMGREWKRPGLTWGEFCEVAVGLMEPLS